MMKKRIMILSLTCLILSIITSSTTSIAEQNSESADSGFLIEQTIARTSGEKNMAEMVLKATGSKLKIVSEIHVTSTQAQYDTCLFEFDKAWDGYGLRTAVFYSHPKNIKAMVLDMDNRCFIPWDAFSHSRYLYIGVYGSNGESYLPTQFVEVMYQPGANADDHLYPPTPGIYEQIAAGISGIENKLNTKANIASLDEVITLVNSKASATETNALAAELQQLENIKASKSELAALSSQVASIASGSPKGTFPTVADLQAAKPSGDAYVYVVSADGKWYYWNGSQWTAGGTYAAAPVRVSGVVKSDGADNFSPAVTEDFLGEYARLIQATNLHPRGDFSAGLTGFTIEGMSGTVTDETATLTASSAGARITGPFNCIAGRRYLGIAQVKASSSLVRLTVGAISKFLQGTGAWETVYVVHTATASQHGISIFDDRTSGWNAIQIKGMVVIELTSSLETVDRQKLVQTITNLPGSFFAGTQQLRSVDLTGKYTVPWLRTTDPTGFAGVKKVSNLFDPLHQDNVDGAFVLSSTGAINSNTGYALSHFIPVVPGERYTVSHAPSEVAAYYNASKQFISGLHEPNAPASAPYDYTLRVPQNAGIQFMRVNIRKSTTPVSGYVVSAGATLIHGDKYSSEWDHAVKPLAGKTLLVTGDSITEKNFRASTNWHDYIADWLGCNIKNDGKSSTGLIRGNPSISADGILARIENWDAIYGTFDAIAVMGNMNDGALGSAFPVGQFSDAPTVQSQYGAVKATIEKLITKYPNKPIVWIISTPRKESYSDVQSNGKAWGKDGWFEPYCQAILEVCAHYGVPCLDLYHGSGLRPWNDTNNATFFSSAQDPQGDGVHPNAAGQLVIAHKIRLFLEQNIMK